MSREVDELFGAEDAPSPRSALVLALLLSGVVFAILGMACSAAPGGILVLLAWMVVEKELDRVDSGYLAETDRPTVRGLRAVTLVGLVLVVILFIVQGYLLCSTNLYEELLELALTWAAPPP